VAEEEIIGPIIRQIIGGIGGRIGEGPSEVEIRVGFKEEIL
jgi:hypothetical protein